jgi:hypothetical protein
MKKILFILSFIFIAGGRLFAQDDDDQNEGGGEKIRDKMNEFIQKRLDLSKDEAEKFTPIFLRYFKEWRQTLRENKGDRLVLQQKIVDLRLRYRPQFREILGDKRGNQVYNHQDVFIKELRDIQHNRINNPNRPLKRRVNRLF